MDYDIKLIRRHMPSDTPDDEKFNYFIPVNADASLLRYGTYGLDGIIKGYGNELNYEKQGQNFIIKSGKAVIMGDTVEVGGQGVVIDTGTPLVLTLYTVYIEINRTVMNNEFAKIKVLTTTGDTYLTVSGDDLTVNPQGIARKEIYRFANYNGTISTVVEKRMSVLEYSNDTLNNFKNQINTDLTNFKSDTATNLAKKAEFYTGSTQVQLDLPIGSIVLAMALNPTGTTNQNIVPLNQAFTGQNSLYVRGFGAGANVRQAYVIGGTTVTGVMIGVWVNRGILLGATSDGNQEVTNYVLCQRIS